MDSYAAWIEQAAGERPELVRTWLAVAAAAITNPLLVSAGAVSPAQAAQAPAPAQLLLP